MASSELQIMNMALRYAGDYVIDDTQKGSPDDEPSRLVVQFFDQARARALEAGTWTVATKSLDIVAESPGAPSKDYVYEYLLPSDFLRLLSVRDASHEADYAVEGESIHSNLGSPLSIRYIWDQTDTTKFKPLLVTAVAYSLASDLVMALTNSKSQRDAMIEGMMLAVSMAKSKDAVQKPPKSLQAGSWLTARRKRG